FVAKQSAAARFMPVVPPATTTAAPVSPRSMWFLLPRGRVSSVGEAVVVEGELCAQLVEVDAVLVGVVVVDALFVGGVRLPPCAYARCDVVGEFDVELCVELFDGVYRVGMYFCETDVEELVVVFCIAVGECFAQHALP